MDRWRKFIPWLGLASIVAAFVLAVFYLHPTNLFGLSEDDSIYFSSAKALAQGKGYVIASFPGSPTATKYPIFYPWLLSWIWRWNPSFPSNVTYAIALNVAFGGLYIVAAFLFFRRFGNLNVAEALALTAVCGLNPLIVFYSGSLLSEIPFAVLALAALLLADQAIRVPFRPIAIIACGILVGLSMLTRGFGVPIAAGIIVAAAAARAWRQLVGFCATVAPFFAALALKTVSAGHLVAPVAPKAASTLGWIHEWTYYTSYAKVWQVGIPTPEIFLKMLKNNLVVLLYSPANYFLTPIIRPGTILGTAAALIVIVAAGVGLFRDARENGIRSIHYVLPFYLLLVVLWSYPDAGRFLLPFMPLLLLGIWLESKRVLLMAQRTFAGSASGVERLLAATLALIIAGILSTIVLNDLKFGNSAGVQLSNRRAALLAEKQEAYQWISDFAPANARVVAYEDAALYLYTGRQAARPFTFTTADFYDPGRLEPDLDHLTDVAHAIGADYWVTAVDDYGFEWPEAYERAHFRMQSIEASLPLVFRSRQGHVRIYSLKCASYVPKTRATWGNEGKEHRETLSKRIQQTARYVSQR